MNKSKKDGRFMEFRLGELFFAVPLLSVREVLQNLTQPMSPICLPISKA